MPTTLPEKVRLEAFLFEEQHTQANPILWNYHIISKEYPFDEGVALAASITDAILGQEYNPNTMVKIEEDKGILYIRASQIKMIHVEYVPAK